MLEQLDSNGRSMPVVEPVLPDEEGHRAVTYRLLARLLAAAPDQALLDRLSELAGDGTDYGAALGALADAAANADPRDVEREFHDLFIGVGEGELVPYGSYYLTGFLHERPLARLRRDMRALGIARADDAAEPEDGLASLCEIMAGLIDGTFGAAHGIERQRAFFEAHVAPWAARFFADLEAAPSARFYRAIGVLGRTFIAIETEAFLLPA